MNRWLQSKEYRCSSCGAQYLHDRAYQHAVYQCPARPKAKRPMKTFVGRTYEPKAER